MGFVQFTTGQKNSKNETEEFVLNELFTSGRLGMQVPYLDLDDAFSVGIFKGCSLGFSQTPSTSDAFLLSRPHPVKDHLLFDTDTPCKTISRFKVIALTSNSLGKNGVQRKACKDEKYSTVNLFRCQH